MLNYCAALTIILEVTQAVNPYPVVLNITDNTSALNWTRHACKMSIIGRRLGRFFCGLLIGSNVGINSKWIDTKSNEIADTISRIREEKSSSTRSPTDHPTVDYSALKQKYSALQHCCFFYPKPKLLSMIWDVVLMRKFPNLKEIRRLRQCGLGKLTP